MDRTAARNAFDALKQKAWDAQDAADAAAAQAGATADAITKAQQDYNVAIQHQRDRVKGANTEVDKAQAVLDNLDDQTGDAQTAYTAFTTAWQAANDSWQQQLQNANTVENVGSGPTTVY